MIMRVLRGAINFLRRLCGGKNLLAIQQDRDQWDRQYARGAWNFLRDGERQRHLAVIRRFIKERLAEQGTLKVLDVGCGNGAIAAICRDLGDDIIYTGIDFSSEAIFAARQVYPGGAFVIGDAVNPPVFPHSFDVMVFAEVLYYVSIATVAQVYRTAAAPDGVVIVSMLDMWRTPFIWLLLRRYVHACETVRIRAHSGRNSWTIKIGRFL